jgi:hypothetical protein
MSTAHESPVKKFPGSVTMPDYLSYPQVLAFRRAVKEAKELGDDVPLFEYNHALLPGIIPCVEKWEIPSLPQSITADSFPVAPSQASQRFTAWLIRLVTELMNEAEDIPNA